MLTKNVHQGKAGAHVTPEKYNAMRAAILNVLSSDDRGLTWDELVDAIAPQFPEGLFAHMGSVRWYSKAVQLDLEAHGLIERLPNTRPMRLRRCEGSGLA